MTIFPTAIRKSFAHPECLPDIPSTILAHPWKIRPIPTKIVTINAVAAGNEIARPANMSTSIPRPIVTHFPLTGRKIPVMIFSIPTINKIIASITIRARNVTAGWKC
ncbi:MAG: hypothetical protein QOK79_06500 [Nitrososphaeraceae archaeon]|nr:hypothetical protein [Nitrososphaeraceae archaeon]